MEFWCLRGFLGSWNGLPVLRCEDFVPAIVYSPSTRNRGITSWYRFHRLLCQDGNENFNYLLCVLGAQYYLVGDVFLEIDDRVTRSLGPQGRPDLRIFETDTEILSQLSYFLSQN